MDVKHNAAPLYDSDLIQEIIRRKRGGKTFFKTQFRLFIYLITLTFAYFHICKHCEIMNCVQFCSYSAGGESETLSRTIVYKHYDLLYCHCNIKE